MKSIQSKILLVVISGLLVITAVVSIISVNMTHDIMHKDADRILENATQKEAAYINDMLGDIVKSSSIMEHYAITEVESVEDFKDPDFCADYLEKAEEMFSEVALNTTGVEGFYMRIDPNLSNGTTGFYKTIKSDGSIKDMPITDLNKYNKDDKRNVGWYYEAINAGEGIWLDPYYFPGIEQQLISFVQPIYVKDKLIGTIGFDMNFSYLVEKIDSISVYEFGYTSMLSKDGTIRYNNSPIVYSDNPHTESKVELINGMFLVMHADYKDIQKDIHPMLEKIVFAFIIVLLCSIIYTFLFTRRIVKPLKRLTVAAEKVSGGLSNSDFSKIPIDSKDEIGTLSRALLTTYSKIQEYTTYINTLAYRDSLTGIKNSTAYAEAIAEINQEILTGNPEFGVIVADINNLKEANDKYGHDVGNDLIIQTSKILISTFQSSAVYRVGGDEFAIILKGNDYQQYRNLMEKMDNSYLNSSITVGETSLPISVARGVSIYDQSIDRVYEDVFAKADQAMYMNKEKIKSALVN